jgi:multicomponent Na+:H+ antiporter subunit D
MDWEALKHHLPALVVVVPLVGGVTAALFGQRRRGWWMALLSTLLVFAGAAWMLSEALWDGAQRVVYVPGNWATPLGITYVVDPLSAVMLLVLATAGVVATVFALHSVEAEVPAPKRAYFYGLWMLMHAGLIGVVVSGDVFHLFVMLELALLSAVALVAMGRKRHRRALPSAMSYLLFGSVGAGFVLAGIGYLYMITGTLDMAAMSERLHAIYLTWHTPEPMYLRTVLIGLSLIVLGLCMNVALVPLQFWLPNACTHAPSALAVQMATATTFVAAYALVRVIYDVVGTGIAFGSGLPLDVILMACGAAAVLYGSVNAIFQGNLKRMMAFAVVAQVGYLVLAMALDTPPGLAAALMHLLSNLLIAGALFMALGVLAHRLGSVNLSDLKGLGRRMPVTTTCLTVCGLALIGMPFTAGFVSKWYLLLATFNAGRYELAVVIAAGSGFAVAFVWRTLEVLYTGQRKEVKGKVSEAPASMLLPMVFMTAAVIYFGVDASLPYELASRTAAYIRGLGA